MSHDLDTYSKITLPILNVSVLSDAKYIKSSVDTPPQGEIEKDKFNKKYFQYLAHAQTVENVGSALEHGRNVMNKIREIEKLNVDVSKLNETIRSLDTLIKDRFRDLKDIRNG